MEKSRFIGYEYQDVTVKRGMASIYADGYENFGWELESAEAHAHRFDAVVMRFKRDRKIHNKAELTRLQRNFDACVSDILTMETRKYVKASAVAYAVGILGTACMAGSVFFVTAGQIAPCVLLAIPAFIGWLLPYFLYKTLVRKKTAQVTPLIEEKYDELYAVCEKANALLDGADR